MVQQKKAFEAFESFEAFQVKVYGFRSSSKEGGRQRRGETSKDLPEDLAEMYKTDPEESYGQRKTRIQWIRRYWEEQWFKYRFTTQEYAEKSAIKRPWGDILYKNLLPRSRDEAIAQSFCPCMVRGPQPDDAHPSSLPWCRDDNLFKRNFQFAQQSAKQNKKKLGLDFNPGPSAPRADGTRDAEPNIIGPYANLEGLITCILAQGTAVNDPPADSKSDEAPAVPKPKQTKKPKASKPAPASKISRAKPLKTAPPEVSVQSEDVSRVSKPQKAKVPQPHTGKELTAAAILRSEAIDLSSDEDRADDALEQLIKRKEEAEIFNDLPLFDVTIIHNFIDEWFDTPNIRFEDL